MGLKFWDVIRPKNGQVATKEITCKELFHSAMEVQIRELCLSVCTNMIANAIGRCEFRTFRDNKEIYERDYFLWNFEPNANQNSTEFLHKLITKLVRENEALVVSTRKRDGGDALVVADSFSLVGNWPSKQNEYKGVTVGDLQYDKTFKENDVLHFKLNHLNVRPVIDGIYESYRRLIESAMKDYTWQKGKHLKVHVNQVRQGADEWLEQFNRMISDQVKPFLQSDGAILPEFDGYEYSEMGNKQANGGTATQDIRTLINDVFDFTAQAMLIPAVLVKGSVEGTADANTRFLTSCIDPICDQLQEEITRKRYGYDEWRKGNFLRVDSSSIIHFDMFANAANVEKLVGSGAYTINDVRRAANQAQINEPWADEHYMTLNISTMDESTRQISEKGGES